MKVILLKVPFLEKDAAKALGAKWDFVQKSWYIYDDMDQEPFCRWLPKEVGEPPKPSETAVSSVEAGVSLTEYLTNISQAVKRAVPAMLWIRAEISRVDLKRGHCHLELVDSDSNGRQLAKCHAIIWQDQAEDILSQFQEQTGGELKEGMKILLQGRADLSVLYGFSIHIENIDPSYTLGNLMANLRAIREKLQKEKLYGKNKLLPLPKDFTAVAVISPTNAAGLGDFRKEADVLMQYGLCEFTYYEAVFQGKSAGQEITEQIAKVMRDHADKQFDGLVIIRGGGAQTDLAWLNDYQIASAICRATIPVFAGIGHERDNTIIDEVSCCRFDTPSKVIKHIWMTIINNAVQAQTQIGHVFERATFLVAQSQKRLDALSNIIPERAAQILQAALVQLKHVLQILDLSSPNKILQRGFALVRSKNQELLTSKKAATAKFQSDGEFKLIFADGDLIVTDIK